MSGPLHPGARNATDHLKPDPPNCIPLSHLALTIKRKSNFLPTQSAKQRQTGENSHVLSSAFKDAESARVQAEPYQLATAKFPINALTPTWSIGKNRPV